MSEPIIHIDDAAYQHVETMLPRADGTTGPYLWWHGWVIREAFIAGVKWQAQREHAALQAIADAESAANTRAYDERCDGCKELIAMAREGVDGEPATIGESEVVTVEPTRLTTEEVFERVKALEYCAEVTIEQVRVAFLKQLWCHEDEEVHDAVRHCCYDLQEILEGVGLRAVEIGSDNDSVWGVIEEAQP